jgi:hypothetical protein
MHAQSRNVKTQRTVPQYANELAEVRASGYASSTYDRVLPTPADVFMVREDPKENLWETATRWYTTPAVVSMI